MESHDENVNVDSGESVVSPLTLCRYKVRVKNNTRTKVGTVVVETSLHHNLITHDLHYGRVRDEERNL